MINYVQLATALEYIAHQVKETEFFMIPPIAFLKEAIQTRKVIPLFYFDGYATISEAYRTRFVDVRQTMKVRGYFTVTYSLAEFDGELLSYSINLDESSFSVSSAIIYDLEYSEVIQFTAPHQRPEQYIVPTVYDYIQVNKNDCVSLYRFKPLLDDDDCYYPADSFPQNGKFDIIEGKTDELYFDINQIKALFIKDFSNLQQNKSLEKERKSGYFDAEKKRLNRQFISMADSINFIFQHENCTYQEAFNLIFSSLFFKQIHLKVMDNMRLKAIYICSEKEINNASKAHITVEALKDRLTEKTIDNELNLIGFGKKRFYEHLSSMGVPFEEKLLFEAQSPDIEYPDSDETEGDSFAYYNELPKEYEVIKRSHDRLEQRLNQIMLESPAKDIDKLRIDNDRLSKELAAANSELAELKERLRNQTKMAVKPANIMTFQDYNWQALTQYNYPPELHLALIIWERSYLSNEIDNPYLKDHAPRFNLIAERIGLSENQFSGALIRRLQQTTTPQVKKNKADVDKLRAIKLLNFKDLY